MWDVAMVKTPVKYDRFTLHNMPRMRVLFAGPRLEGRLERRKADMVVEILGLCSRGVTGKADPVVAETIRRYHVEPVKVFADKKTVEFHKNRACGMLMTASVPYAGDINIVDCTPPGTESLPRVWCVVSKSGVLTVKFRVPAPVDENDADMRFYYWHHMLMRHVDAANRAVEEHNESLPDIAECVITERLKRRIIHLRLENIDLKRLIPRAA